MRTAKFYRYALPIETGVILHGRRLRQREGILVQLTENGWSGWGEIAPLPTFSRETLAQAERQCRAQLAGWLKGDHINAEACFPSVAFGLSCALAELYGELGEQANYRAALLCNGDPIRLREALACAEGKKIGKIKVGRLEAARDGVLVDRLLKNFPDLTLRLDANRAWSLEQAVEFAEKIANEHKARIQFIEEPCRIPSLSRRFAEFTGIAIAWDESTREPDFAVKKEPHLRAIVIKPTLVGSVQKCIALIRQTHEVGLTAVISSALESSLGLTQLARLAQQYTPDDTPGLDTLNLMQTQLLRRWQGCTLPLADLNSAFVRELVL